MKYKFISFDLDGTLLANLNDISDENYAALKALYEMGVVLVPTSGRSLYEMPESVRKCPFFKYAITSSGACTYDLKSETVISSSQLSREEASKVFDLFDKYETLTMTHYKGHSYVDKNLDIEYYNKCRVTKGFKIFIPIYDVAIDDFKSFCRGMEEVELTCTFFAADEDKENFKAELKELGDYTVVSSARDNLEVLSGKADKGVAVLNLAASLGIERGETIGVGDSINDMALIKATGLGIAMGNAVEPLKLCADAVGCKNSEHIAKFILENYF